MIYVQFSDEDMTEIVSYFGSPQDPAVFANYGEIEASDPRWKVYYDKQSPWMQQYLPAPV